MGEQPKKFLSQPADLSFDTKAIHSGHDERNVAYNSLVTPIMMASSFKTPEPDSYSVSTGGYFYSRAANPTRDALQNTLAALDGGKYGFAFASGMGALSTIVGLLSAGDHILCSDDIYGGTNSYLRQVATRMGLEVDFLDFSDLDVIAKGLKKNTKMIWFESPSNPSLIITDIRALSKMAHDFGDIIVVIDNTILTPYFQRPLELGVDIVMHSLTKYMNGHSDVIMGAAILNDEDLFKRLRHLHIVMGNVPSPFDCFLVSRGIKSLSVRMDRHQSNSLAIAKFLEQHPAVLKVLHPGLPSHPQHKLAVSQSYGHSGLFSFYIKGELADSVKFLKALKLITLAASLGGVESNIEIPSRISHKPTPAEQRARLGITDNLIRISVGLECEADLIADLDQALKTIKIN